MGLPRWHGKRFTPVGDGELADGLPAVVVTYGDDAPWPWRWIRDELRVTTGGVLVGMSYVDRPLLRRGGLPFLLHREP